MTYDQGNNAARNVPTSAATSGRGVFPSPSPMGHSSGSATTADGKGFIHPKHEEWMELRGLDPELAARLGICTKNEGGANWLAFPFIVRGRVVNHQYRMTSDKRFRMDEGAPLTLWNHDVLLEETDKPLLITEGMPDALAAIQSGFSRCVSVPNGAPQQATDNPAESKRYEYLWQSKDLLDRVKQFIIATDNDVPGRILAADLARLLGPERCKFISFPDGAKDLNDVLLSYGPSGVVDIVHDAKPYPVKGLYRLSDFPEPPPTISVPVGIDWLDDYFALTLGTFSVISGWAGHGKTSLLMRMLANLMIKGVNIALGSFETLPRPILERRMRACLYRCEESDPRANRPGQADELMAERLSVIAHTARDSDTELDLDYIIELAKVAVLRDGIRLLVLDPWNEIEHKRGPDESETEYTSRAIRSLKRFALNYECAVWLVAHPRKPHSDGNPKPPSLYDLAGSAHFANKADYGLPFFRNAVAHPLEINPWSVIESCGVAVFALPNAVVHHWNIALQHLDLAAGFICDDVNGHQNSRITRMRTTPAKFATLRYCHAASLLSRASMSVPMLAILLLLSVVWSCGRTARLCAWRYVRRIGSWCSRRYPRHRGPVGWCGRRWLLP